MTSISILSGAALLLLSSCIKNTVPLGSAPGHARRAAGLLESHRGWCSAGTWKNYVCGVIRRKLARAGTNVVGIKLRTGADVGFIHTSLKVVVGQVFVCRLAIFRGGSMSLRFGQTKCAFRETIHLIAPLWVAAQDLGVLFWCLSRRKCSHESCASSPE